jgi:hypothetical protein
VGIPRLKLVHSLVRIPDESFDLGLNPEGSLQVEIREKLAPGLKRRGTDSRMTRGIEPRVYPIGAPHRRSRFPLEDGVDEPRATTGLSIGRG